MTGNLITPRIKNLLALCCFLTAIISPATAFAADKQFDRPAVDGKRLDWCLNWGENCGKPAADAFCKLNGYANATQWRVATSVGPTWVLGDQRSCGPRSCDGFASITCTGITGGRRAPSERDLTVFAQQTCESRLDDLEKENAQLLHQIGELQMQLADANRKPYCSDDRRFSINPINNASETCDPYACNSVDGRCHTRCSVTADYCGANGVCNREKEKCIFRN